MYYFQLTSFEAHQTRDGGQEPHDTDQEPEDVGQEPHDGQGCLEKLRVCSSEGMVDTVASSLSHVLYLQCLVCELYTMKSGL